MKNKIQKIASFLGLLILFTNCHKDGAWGVRGEGAIITQTRDLGTFNEIECDVHADVLFTQDDKTSIEISAQENILSVLKMEVVGNTLRLSFKREVWSYEKITIHIHAPSLKRFDLSGSGELIVQNKIEGDQLHLKISGSGKITIPLLVVNHVELQSSGSSTVRIEAGTISTQAISISGSGYYKADQVASESCEISVSGSGEAAVKVKTKLWVTISGSGKVKYYGSPTVVSDISGSGRVVDMD